MPQKIVKIAVESLPVILMIALIPCIKNDFVLTAVYICIVAICLLIKKEKGDFVFLTFGFCAMIVSESIFISTGVETFIRNSLFGLMPLWLPFLWAYAFVAMRRSIKIIES
jgi:hypothetical protein